MPLSLRIKRADQRLVALRLERRHDSWIEIIAPKSVDVVKDAILHDRIALDVEAAGTCLSNSDYHQHREHAPTVSFSIISVRVCRYCRRRGVAVTVDVSSLGSSSHLSRKI